jgi:hypothetical protein
MSKDSVLLFESHKPSKIANTVILTNIMAVTNGKHADIYTELERWTIKTAICTVLHSVVEHATKIQCACGFNCGYSAADFRACRH